MLSGQLVAQPQTTRENPVYRMTPVIPGPDASLDDARSSANHRRQTLFPNSQPPLDPFSWQPAWNRAAWNRATWNRATQPLSSPPKHESPRQAPQKGQARIQLVNHEDTSVVQASGQLIEPEATGTSIAQLTASDTDAPQAATAAAVEAQIEKLEQSAVADDVKAAAQKHYQQSLALLRLADEASLKTHKLKTEVETGPAVIEEIRKRLSEPAEKVDATVSPAATVAELEALRLIDDERLMQARTALDTWNAKDKTRIERKPLMPSLIEKTMKQLAEAREAVPAADAADPAILEARKAEHQSLVTFLERQLLLFQTERTRASALNELFPLQRDLAARTKTHLEKRGDFWRSAIVDAGKRESMQQAAEARQALQDAHPALRDLAQKNAKLTEQRSLLQSFLAKTQTSVAEVSKLAERTETEFSAAREKEERGGLTTAIGILLRNQRSHLPDETLYRDTRRNAEADMARLQLQQLPLEDERKRIDNPVEQAEQLAAELGSDSETSVEEIQIMAVGLLTDRQKYLGETIKDYDTCIKDLAELDIHCRSLVDTTVEFRNYIDARVLWIRSAGIVGLHTPGDAMMGLNNIVEEVHLDRIGSALVTEARASTSQMLLTILVIGLLLGMQSRFRFWITTLSQSGSAKSGPGLGSTVAAVGLTLVIASVWPGIMWGLGRSLAVRSSDVFLLTCGAALQTTAFVFFTIEAFRQMCRSNGIAELHLQWPVDTVRSLHSRLVGLMVAGLPFVFAVRFVESWNEGAWLDSLGRLIFVVGMCVLSISIRRIAKPNGPVFRKVLQDNSTGLLYRTRHIWSLAVTLAPLALAGLSIAGFQYTAEQLLVRFEATVWLFIALMAAFGLLIRRMNMAARQLANNQARQRRETEVAPTETKERLGEVMPDVAAEQIDLSRLGSQVLRLAQIAACVLFAAGAWVVWAEVLPALQVFDRVELWSTWTEVTKEVETADGSTKTVIMIQETPVSLGSVILAFGVLALFVAASRNLPGLLELSVLQHIPMDDGGRNAISTLCRYALFTTGIALSASMIGVDWSSVSWLLAALTVGLGFGLQEIFANFVSGLIILFERPVRIGDVVTIDNVSGKVSRIQIRATTITDFDRKEYIVPNKEFVTGRVLNWTLSDKTNRIKIEVGVGYGQDTMLARALLMQVAKENPKVLIDPAPLATFEGFGDSCLMLSLRCFIPGLDDRLQVITDLHEAIDREFRKQNLEIAFPQRDIHIRTMAPLPAAQSATQPVQRSDAEMDVPAELDTAQDRKAA